MNVDSLFFLDVNQCISVTFSALPLCGWMFRRCCFASGLVFLSFFWFATCLLASALCGGCCRAPFVAVSNLKLLLAV